MSSIRDANSLIPETDLPLATAAPTDELRAVRGGKPVRVPIGSLPPSADVQAQIDVLAAGQAAGQKVYRTWSELSAITGSAGVGAQVIDDTGTHTDPVVGGTVSNAGQYVWSESPAGWRWVRPDSYASTLQYRGTVSGGSLNDVVVPGMYIVGSGASDIPGGMTSGLLVVENFDSGNFVVQSFIGATSSQIGTRYERIIRPGVPSYPGWTDTSAAVADGAVSRSKLTDNFAVNGTVNSGSIDALVKEGRYVINSGTSGLPSGITSGLLEVVQHGDFLRQCFYSTTSSQVGRKWERICRVSTSSYPGWIDVTYNIQRAQLQDGYNFVGTLSTGSFNQASKEGQYIVSAALSDGPSGAPSSGLLSVRNWSGGTFIIQEYTGTTFSAVAEKWQRIIRPNVPSYGGWVKLPHSLGRWAGRSVVFAGDSITRQVSATWPEAVTSALALGNGYQCGFAGCTLGRRQFAGDALNDYLRELGMTRLVDAIVSGDFSDAEDAAQYINDNGGDTKVLESITRLASVNFSTLDAMLIGFGTNDFGCSLPIGADSDTDWATFKGAINYTISQLLTEYPNIRLMFWAPMFRARQSPGDGKDSNNHANSGGIYLREYVDALLERCAYYSIPVLDMYAESGINEFNHSSMFSDGLHPYTTAGNTRVANKICAFMEREY